LNELDDYINTRSRVVTFQFFIFGHISEDDITMRTQGLFIQLKLQEYPTNDDNIVFAELIDEEKAKAYDCWQGVSLTFGFTSLTLSAEPVVRDTVVDGLMFLRYRYDYLGAKERESNA